MLTAFVKELHRREPLLAWTGTIHFALFMVMLAASQFDSRIVTGVNVWLKPMKFAVSIGIYVWTIAWILRYVRGVNWAKWIVRLGVAGSMLVEMYCIGTQALRGTTSHYNTSTEYDAAIWVAMGVAIQVSILIDVFLLVLLFVRTIDMSRLYLWSVRIGLLVFIVLGSIPGFAMAASGAHNVGIDDGGPGMPVTNWSTEGGDLRVAHLVGLHSLQIIPLLGFLLSRRENLAIALRYLVLVGFTSAYVAGFMFVFIQATGGAPLLSFG